MTDFKIQIEKQKDESHWPKWKFTIHHMLNSQGLQEVVEDIEKKPEGVNPIPIFEWKKRDSQALLIISAHIDRLVFERLEVIESACQAWHCLISIYEQSSGHRLDRLAEEFFTVKDSGQDMISHIANLQRIFHDFRNEMMKQLKVDLPE